MVELMEHQKRACSIALEHRRYAYFWDCGTGKTIAMLAAIKENPVRTAVACPKSIIEPAWLADAEHFPDLKVISGRAATRLKRLEKIHDTTWDVIVLNYEMVKKHWEDLLKAGVERFVFDESAALKNPKSQTTKTCLKIASRVKYLYLLSGVPAPNGEHEYWAQLRAVYPEATAGSYYQFCNRYMMPLKKRFGDREFIAGWKLRQNKLEEFENLLSARCWSLRKEDCIDLPPQTDAFRNVELSAKELEAYIRMRDQLRAEFDGFTVNATTQGRFMKLRQLAGGIFYDGEEILSTGTSKVDELVAVIEEIGLDKPVVIWAEFRGDIKRIGKRLSRDFGEGTAAIIDGSTPDALRTEYITEFGKKIKYLVCHPRTVGHGVTLVQASYAIYYSLGFSFEAYAQSRDRIHRVGQKDPCTYIHLLSEHTCDSRILEALQKKESSHEAIRSILSGEDELSGEPNSWEDAATRSSLR